jgi:hypothetical protein
MMELELVRVCSFDERIRRNFEDNLSMQNLEALVVLVMHS